MRLLFGDNQFLGVNHSMGRGVEYLSKYDSMDAIANTLTAAWNEGLRDFAFTVTPKTVAALSMISTDCPFRLHPAIPYAQNVNNEITNLGLPGAIIGRMKSVGFIPFLGILLGVPQGRYVELFTPLIRSELRGLDLNRVESVGLLNVAADFLLGLHRTDCLLDFIRAVQGEGFSPQIYTMNFPSMANLVWGDLGMDCELIFNINTSGFRMNPSQNAVMSAVEKFSGNKMTAMSVFSGSDPAAAAELFSALPEVQSILFGSSSQENIRNNFRLFTNE